MLTCKQVSEALAKGDYANLPLLSRLMLKFHVSTCMVCGKYNKIVMAFYDCIRGFRAYEETHGNELAVLSEEEKDRLRQVVAGASHRSTSEG